MKDINYLELSQTGKLNNQFWFAELIDGYILECGFGYVENEFSSDTLEKMTTAANLNEPDSDLNIINGYYIFDYTTNCRDKNGIRVHLEDLYDEKHPEDDSFLLIPKSDIVKTWSEIKEIKKPITIKINKIKI